MPDKIKRPQYADNWAFLHHLCLPTNVDGLFHTTQSDQFNRCLFIEVKRGEDLSEGQQRMLFWVADHKDFTVIVLHSKHAEADDRNLREVIPVGYQVIRNRQMGTVQPVTPEAFALRYQQWFLGKDSFVF